jgi:uncharacterized membrane protein
MQDLDKQASRADPASRAAAVPRGMAVPSGFVRGVAAVLGIVTVALGVWAMLSPSSFYDVVATFPPYNRHLLHDVGAFQIGIGAALLLALRWRDALVTALGAYAIGTFAHAVAHLVDRSLGGRALDAPSIAALAVLSVLALVSIQRSRAA